ncbi:MAG TPA: hypothetical protein VFU43_09775 [Streptosporangiaceae bacterium]|nr:hypothetical protein [Streptosporangiaceae bacterium]
MAAPTPYPPPGAPDGRRRRAERSGGRGALIGAGAALAAVVIAAAAIVGVVAKRDRSPSGPDPYAGAYPVVAASTTPSAAITWQPAGPPAGPLKRFPGRATRVVGKIVDRTAGLSYAKLGPPWKQTKGITHTAGIEWDVQKPKFHWWAGAYSDLLRDDFLAAAKGPNGLRAAAELDAAKWAKTYDGKMIPIAGRALKISGRSAWLAGYRVLTPGSWDKIPERALVVVVVNSGRRVPAVFEVSMAKPKYQLLPDINTLVGSLRVVR